MPAGGSDRAPKVIDLCAEIEQLLLMWTEYNLPAGDTGPTAIEHR